MSEHLYLLFPLFCAFLYALAALLVKQAVQGVGPWRLTVVSSWILAGVFSTMWLLPGVSLSELVWYQPLISGLLSFTGNVCGILALTRGDVSVATPILGTKVLMVALLTVLIIGQSVPMVWWIAAVLATLGIFLLWGDNGTTRRHGSATVVYALACSLSFALADVLIQKWVAPTIFTRYMPLMFLTSAVLSLGLVPLFRASLFAIPRSTWRPLLTGSVLMAVQALGFVFAISQFGRATALNIAYSSRGIWSVVLVWAVGHWFKNEERDAGQRVMVVRLAGAALVLIAVVLVTL